jgi:hypothetical protein
MVLFAALLSALPFHAALAATAPNLGTAASFALLGGSAVSYTDSYIIGNVGSPVAVSPVSSTVVGTVYPVGDPIVIAAFGDFSTAYNALAPSTPPPPEQFPCTQTLTGLGGQTLPPGVYCFSSFVAETGTTLTLDGPSDGIWIFKIGTGGSGYLEGTNFTVKMQGGGQPCNVYWWLAEYAALTDSVFIGNILAGTYITVTRGTFYGDALATTAVTLTGAQVSVCGGSSPGPPFPPHCGIKVTGGGQIPVPDPGSKGRATFGFNAQSEKKGDTAKGQFNYVNHVTGLHVNGPVDKILVIATNPDGSAKTVQLSGSCQHGPKCSFIVTVEDHGEPGRNDQFGITVAGKLTEVTSLRVISRGNIEFHDKSCEDNEDNNPCGDHGNH